MYKKMVEEAKAKGLTSEKMMWESIEEIDELLMEMKHSHPQIYWDFIRKTHGMLYKGHYTEEFALHDVDKMEPIGQHWSVKDIEAVMKSMSFPSGVNTWDVYVAFNAFANDLNDIEKDEQQILKDAHAFWFADKDYPTPTKIWDYMCMVWKKKNQHLSK